MALSPDHDISERQGCVLTDLRATNTFLSEGQMEGRKIEI